MPQLVHFLHARAGLTLGNMLFNQALIHRQSVSPTLGKSIQKFLGNTVNFPRRFLTRIALTRAKFHAKIVSKQRRKDGVIAVGNRLIELHQRVAVDG